MSRSQNTMKPLSKRPISMSLSRTQRQSMRFSAVAGLTGDLDSQGTIGESLVTPVTEATPTISTVDDDDVDNNSCTAFDAVEFVTVEADWTSFSQTASQPTHSRLPPVRGDVYPVNQRPSIEYIQEFAFPRGVPIDFLDRERAKLLCSAAGDAVHVMRFCDAQGKQKYATCVLVNVSFQPTEDVLKQNLLQLAVSRAAVDIIKRAWLRHNDVLRNALRATMSSTLTQRPGSFKSVQSNGNYSNRAGGSPRKSNTSIRGLEGLSINTHMAGGHTDSSSSGHTPSPKKRSSKRIHVNHHHGSSSSKHDGLNNSTILINSSSNLPHRNQHYLDQLNMNNGSTAGGGGGGGGNLKTKNKKKFSYLQRFGTSFRKLVGGTTTVNNTTSINNNNNNNSTVPAGGDEKLTVNTALPPSVFSTVSPTHSTIKSSSTVGPSLIYSPMSSTGSGLGGGVDTGGRSAAGGRRKRLDGLKMILDRLGYGGLRCGEDDCVAVTQRAYCLVTGQPGTLYQYTLSTHLRNPLYYPTLSILPLNPPYHPSLSTHSITPACQPTHLHHPIVFLVNQWKQRCSRRCERWSTQNDTPSQTLHLPPPLVTATGGFLLVFPLATTTTTTTAATTTTTRTAIIVAVATAVVVLVLVLPLPLVLVLVQGRLKTCSMVLLEASPPPLPSPLPTLVVLTPPLIP